MKKYIVCRLYSTYLPDVVGEFDEKDDALAYARLSKMSSSNNFAVYELLELYSHSEVSEGFNLTDLGVFVVYI